MQKMHSMYSISKNRPNDFYYDPSYITSSSKDYYKQARSSRILSAKYAVCPIFSNMFSDLQNYPRKQYIMRQPAPIPVYIDKTQITSTKAVNEAISGTDRFKYIHKPSLVTPQETVPPIDTSCFHKVEKEMKAKLQKPVYQKNKAHAKIQTDYRESEMQTSPWQPDHEVVQGDPEVLKLDFLKWGAGLPAGETEVDLLERARMKRKWQQRISNISVDNKSLVKMREIIEQVERNDWLFRDMQIQEIQQLRLELLERMLNELNEKSKCRNEIRIRQFIDMKLKEKNEKLAKLEHQTMRQKRRLQFQYSGILSKYGKADIFNEHADYKSELYAPMTRNGYNPKYDSEVLSKAYKQYRPQYYKVEDFDTSPISLENCADLKNLQLPGRALCQRGTKWTLPVLEELYNDLKNLRITECKEATLRVCLDPDEISPPTPEVKADDEEADLQKQCAVSLQKILRGRATQIKIFVGRERCRELINELRSNLALLRSDVSTTVKLKKKRKEAQLDAKKCQTHMTALESSLRKLGGSVAGTLLDFLNKDLQKLLRERRAHAMILLIERVREIREAEEAGRRQKELRRRAEHDEIFKQVIKVHQDTVDLYLQDIVAEGMVFTSEEQAREYVQKLAVKIDEEQGQMERENDITANEEYIAALVHNVVIPEVEKNIVRQKMELREKKFLKTAHDEIYSTVNQLPKPEVSSVSPSVTSSGSTKSMTAVSTTDKSGVIDVVALEKARDAERKIVEADIRATLYELVAIPYKMALLKRMVPCKIRGRLREDREKPEVEEESLVSMDFESVEEGYWDEEVYYEEEIHSDDNVNRSKVQLQLHLEKRRKSRRMLQSVLTKKSSSNLAANVNVRSRRSTPTATENEDVQRSYAADEAEAVYQKVPALINYAEEK